MPPRTAALLLPGEHIIQLFRLTQNDLGVVRPMFSTFGRAVGGRTSLELLRLPAGVDALPCSGRHAALADGDTQSIARIELAGRQIAEGETVDVPVPAKAVRRGDVLALRIAADDVDASDAPGVWLSSGEDRIPGHLACLTGEGDAGCSGLSATLAFAPPVPSRLLPPAIAYSPVTQCNLNCIHCISRETRRHASRLSGGIKAEIARWADDGRLLALSTDYSGDLLWADHRFGGELDFVIGLGLPFRIDTNGVFLDGDRAERLCGSRVTNVNISLDAARPATYRHIRKGAPPLGDVLDNVRRFMALRAERAGTFDVTLGFTLMASNLDEWCEFIALGAALGVDSINTGHLHAYTADMDAESLWHRPHAYNRARIEALDLAAAHGLPMGTPPPFHDVPEDGHRFCRVPWESALVLGNGDVAACCVPGTVMGNLHEQSMADIWSGERYQRLRATVNTPSAPTPCAICPMFRRVGNRGSYLQHSGRQPGLADGNATDSPFLRSG